MNLSILEKKLGITFTDKNLLRAALTHRSYLNENRNKQLICNERLEFLGDSVLSFVISSYLFKKFNKAKEGDLTNLRAYLVKTETLANLSKSFNLGQFLFLSKGEEESGGRENQSLLANSFEALIGALFINKGLKVTSNFIIRNFLPFIPRTLKAKTLKDYKSLLQEKLQAKIKISPIYKVLTTSGPDHQKTFLIGVFAANKKLGEGRGKSKQEAEERAAQKALKNLKDL